MKIFVGWSGEESGRIGEVIRQWIPSVIQSVKPYYTPNDMENGSNWFSEISSKLAETKLGVICITKDNYNAPWLLFVLGALSQQIDTSLVCPILFGVEPADIDGPLVQFQYTQFKKEEVGKLMKTINMLNNENPLSLDGLEVVFEKWWPDLENDIREIILSDAQHHSNSVIRSDRELLQEVLENVRSIRRTYNLRSILHDDKRDAHESDVARKYNSENNGNDIFYEQAKAVVIKSRRVSIAAIQRSLKIGYNRAAKLVEKLECDGVVSSADGKGSREVLQ